MIINTGSRTDTVQYYSDWLFKKVRHSGNRLGCRCMENRNIGDYDTCPNGCKYCYANCKKTLGLII